MKVLVSLCECVCEGGMLLLFLRWVRRAILVVAEMIVCVLVTGGGTFGSHRDNEKPPNLRAFELVKMFCILCAFLTPSLASKAGDNGTTDLMQVGCVKEMAYAPSFQVIFLYSAMWKSKYTIRERCWW